WKNKGLGPAEIAEGDARAFANGRGRELYAAYQDRLKTLNSCDFGDLLCHPIRILRANPDILAEYHARFKYILVDEYQDTNTAQYMWLRLLAQRKSHVDPRSENRGEAQDLRHQGIEVERAEDDGRPISPLVGEMPGRAEGGGPEETHLPPSVGSAGISPTRGEIRAQTN
ncbi:MAG: ATP-dependent helicase, partial [Flavobacteriales bacterium]|nr:ATP-dependent helicase [Flavobacteriales bacterium]